jgi:hypothetical protein
VTALPLASFRLRCPHSPALRRRLERRNAALPAPPPGVRSRNRARITRAKNGTLTLSVTAIPLDELEAFVEVLREHLLGEE